MLFSRGDAMGTPQLSSGKWKDVAMVILTPSLGLKRADLLFSRSYALATSQLPNENGRRWLGVAVQRHQDQGAPKQLQDNPWPAPSLRFLKGRPPPLYRRCHSHITGRPIGKGKCRTSIVRKSADPLFFLAGDDTATSQFFRKNGGR